MSLKIIIFLCGLVVGNVLYASYMQWQYIPDYEPNATRGNYAVASASDESEIFSGMAWGDMKGVSLLQSFNSNWSNKQNSEGLETPPEDGLPKCKAGTGSKTFHIWVASVLYYDEFFFKMDYATDGCNITNLTLSASSPPTARFNRAKLLIISVQTQDDQYGDKCCGCKPKCLSVLIGVKMELQGLIQNSYADFNIRFSLCANSPSPKTYDDFEGGWDERDHR